jgi:hypothetical protein
VQPDAHRPPPAQPAKAGGNGKAGAKGAPRRPKTDEEWLNEAMTKVAAAAAKAGASGDNGKMHDYNESLKVLQKLHERLTQSDPSMQAQVRQELTAIRSSFK